MHRTLRTIVCCAALGAASLPAVGHAQAYPAKPVRTIMTVAGGADVIARIVAQRLTETLGQPVVVESQSGAGGAVGAETVARANADGYTLMLTSASTMIMHGFLSKQTRFDPVKNFEPITKVAETILLIVSNPSLPVNSVKELVDYARRNPGKISYGTSGIGTSHHLSAEMIRLLTGIDWVHVPYKGGPPVLTDLMSGQIQVGFSILATMTPFRNTGKIKILAVNNDGRYPVIPDVPTVSEQIPGYEAPPTWMAYFGPAGLPQPIVKRLNAEIGKTMNAPEVKAKTEQIGFRAATSSPEEVTQMIRRDLAITAKLVKAVGIQPE
jgi:tripartite-type tricarboxylate transporter receptor subunit TctC